MAAVQVGRPVGAIRIPALFTPSSVAWLAAGGVAALAMSVHVFVAEPGNQVFVVAVVALMTAWCLALFRSLSWVQPDDGSVTVVHRHRNRIRARLEASARVELASTGAGVLMLRVHRPGSRRPLVVTGVLALDLSIERSLDPDVPRLLAGTMERHGACGARVVAQDLRAQASHVESGQDPRASALASRTTVGARVRLCRGGPR